MAKLNKKSVKSGLEPGSLIYIGNENAHSTKISIIGYDENNIDITEVATLDECIAAKAKYKTVWINITGLLDTPLISKLCEGFNIHPLVVEDILNTNQRPKMDILSSYIFLIIRLYFYNQLSKEYNPHQISFIIGTKFVISIQEKINPIFAPIRERLKNPQNLIRRKGSDYLAYALTDIAIDSYFKIIESIGDEIEELEEILTSSMQQSKHTLKRIHYLRRETIFLRKAVWPLRDIISRLQMRIPDLIGEGIVFYIKDIYDHTVQVIDSIETYRDLLGSLFEIYLSNISNKMNEVMKVLTVFASIFIPLTFVTGLYGMNFNTAAGPLNMPELNWKYGYVSLWAAMITLTVIMLIYFKRKRWW